MPLIHSIESASRSGVQVNATAHRPRNTGSWQLEARMLLSGDQLMPARNSTAE
jgi:hypothetical protein